MTFSPSADVSAASASDACGIVPPEPSSQPPTAWQ
jgi:hypothetical protein